MRDSMDNFAVRNKIFVKIKNSIENDTMFDWQPSVTNLAQVRVKTPVFRGTQPSRNNLRSVMSNKKNFWSDRSRAWFVN